MRISTLVWGLAATLTLVGGNILRADDAPAPAPGSAPAPGIAPADLKDRVLKAYHDLSCYQATVIMVRHEKQGRITQTMESDYKVAVDRANNRVLIDRPEFLIVSDGAKLRLRSEQFPGRHLEVSSPAKLDAASLTAAVPVLDFHEMPDAMLLFSSDPIAGLAGQANAVVKVLAPAADTKQPGLEFTDSDGNVWTLRVDPATNLLASAALAVDPTKVRAGDAAGVVQTITIVSRNQPLDAKVFAFDTANSTAFPSIDALVNAGGGPGPAHPLEGQPAPAFSLKMPDGKTEVKLADLKDKVIVLDFWATWCGPCRKSLPLLHQVGDWAGQEKKSVAIYAVNVQEDAAAVTDFWKQNKFTLPILMDADGAVSQAYGVQGIPQTVIISGGKVQHVHVGFTASLNTELQAEIDKLLAAPATQPAQP